MLYIAGGLWPIEMAYVAPLVKSLEQYSDMLIYDLDAQEDLEQVLCSIPLGDSTEFHDTVMTDR